MQEDHAVTQSEDASVSVTEQKRIPTPTHRFQVTMLKSTAASENSIVE